MDPVSQSAKRQKRSIIFWIFIGIAIPAMFFTLSYAAGYRFDQRTRSVIQTSAVAIHTIPKEANVLFNGKVAEDKTPFIENNLLPGQYTIRVEKDGYHSWEKTIGFEKGLSEIFPEVILFLDRAAVASTKSSAEQKELFGNQPDAFVSLPKKFHTVYSEEGFTHPEKLLFLAGDLDLVVDPEQRVSYLLPNVEKFEDETKIGSVIETAEWNDDNVLLYTTEFELWTVGNDGEETFLLTRQSSAILDAIWHPKGGYILFSDANGLYAIELDARDHRQIWKLDSHSSPTALRINSKGDVLNFTSTGKQFDLKLYE